MQVSVSVSRIKALLQHQSAQRIPLGDSYQRQSVWRVHGDVTAMPQHRSGVLEQANIWHYAALCRARVNLNVSTNSSCRLNLMRERPTALCRSRHTSAFTNLS